MNRLLIILLSLVTIFSCKSRSTTSKVTETPITTTAPSAGIPNINETFLPQYIAKTSKKPTLDGKGLEKSWSKATWRNMDQVMVGETPSQEDFQGRYKLLWDEDMIYILAEIKDDIFIDTHSDGLDKYWDDDCLEIFIDEDRSGGGHQYNHNAFAYHLSLDDKVVDIGVDRKPQYFNDHIEIGKQRNKNMIVWEVGLRVYNDQYFEKNKDNENCRVKLEKGKQIGFMVAYCDNDNSTEREHFVGDMLSKEMIKIEAGLMLACLVKLISRDRSRVFHLHIK